MRRAFPQLHVIELHVPDCPRLEAGIPATPQPRVVLLQGAVGLVQGGGVLVEPAVQADGRVAVEGIMEVEQEFVVPIPPRLPVSFKILGISSEADSVLPFFR